MALLAPDSFKGTFRADQVADYLAVGARKADWWVSRCPLADGGAGTLDVIGAVQPMDVHHVHVHDAVGLRVSARVLMHARREVAVIEVAELLRSAPPTAAETSSRGVGELIGFAAAAGARRVLVGVGGVGMTDGGAGMIDALPRAAASRRLRIDVLCDTSTRYEDAAAAADPVERAKLTRRLHNTAATLPHDPRGVRGSGCGGGLAGALWAHGAQLVSGPDAIMDLFDVDSKMASVDLVLTGEGRLDQQTLVGKVIARLASRARLFHRPMAVVAGEIALTPIQVTSLGVVAQREASTPEEISAAARAICAEVAGELSRGGGI